MRPGGTDLEMVQWVEFYGSFMDRNSSETSPLLLLQKQVRQFHLISDASMRPGGNGSVGGVLSGFMDRNSSETSPLFITSKTS